MTEIGIDLKAKDQMSSVLDHVTQRMGIFNKAGIGMGLAFAGVNLAISGLQQAFNGIIQFVQDGIEANRQFEVSLARLSTSTTSFDISMGSLKNTLRDFSVMFATDLGSLTTGMQDFIREGYSASESVSLLWQAERLAITSGNDLATTQDVLVRTLHEFNLGVGDANDVTKKLNDITSVTGMSLSDIDIILGRVAVAAQKSGISFDDLINLMYTLHETGTSNRFLASQLTKELENLGSVTINPMPDSTATSIDTKFQKISGTVQFTSDMMKQLRTIAQMDLSGGMDLGNMFDKGAIDAAKGFFDTLNKQGITSLQQFNDEIKNNVSAYGAWSDIPIAENKVMLQLIRTYYEYNDELKKANGNTDDSTNKWTAAANAIKQIKSNLDTFKQTLADDNAALTQVMNDISDMTEMRQFTIDTHNATLAVQAQEDAIAALQRATDKYSLSQAKNNLEILKIQYGADPRHGLNRNEKEKIAELEHTNQGLQIKEQENQISIMTIQQNGLQQAQDTLDSIRRQHDDAMYGEQIRDLDKNIAAKNALYITDLANVKADNVAIAAEMVKFRNNELVKTISWAQNMHKWRSFANGGSQTGSTSTESTGSSSFDQIWQMHIKTFHGGVASAVDKQRIAANLEPIPGLDIGGTVLETGIAKVHRGETYFPPGQQAATASSNNVEINVGPVTINANNADDVEEWGKRLGAGLSSGFLSSSSSGTTTVTSRKTGATIIVPGTTVTTRSGRTPTATIPVQQPIQTKGRFRVG